MLHLKQKIPNGCAPLRHMHARAAKVDNPVRAESQISSHVHAAHPESQPGEVWAHGGSGQVYKGVWHQCGGCWGAGVIYGYDDVYIHKYIVWVYNTFNLHSCTMQVQEQPHLQLQQQIPAPGPATGNNLGMQPDQQMDDSPDLYKGARNQFVFKVYSILAMQLLFTTTAVLLTILVPEIAKWLLQNFGLSVLAMFTAVGCLIVLIFKRQWSEIFPNNMIILAIFTLAESYVVSTMCTIYDNESVILAAGVTAAATIGITLYAKFSRSGFSTYKEMLGAFGTSVIAVLACITFINFYFRIPIVSSVIAFALAIVYSLYILYDTLLIMDHVKHNLSLDQYVLASLFLYVDIVGLFLNILRILGSRRR